MRVTIAGKGGAGKTTIAGTLARCLGRRTGSVLAMDADSNPNLAITLGLSRQVSEGIDGLPKDVLEQYTDEEGKNRLRLSSPIDSVIDKYSVQAPDGVRLLVVGKVGHAGAG